MRELVERDYVFRSHPDATETRPPSDPLLFWGAVDVDATVRRRFDCSVPISCVRRKSRNAAALMVRVPRWRSDTHAVRSARGVVPCTMRTFLKREGGSKVCMSCGRRRTGRAPSRQKPLRDIRVRARCASVRTSAEAWSGRVFVLKWQRKRKPAGEFQRAGFR